MTEAEIQDTKTQELEIEKFLSMTKRFMAPDVKLRSGDESVDELLLFKFNKLSDFDKVTIFKMAALFSPSESDEDKVEKRDDEVKPDSVPVKVTKDKRERRSDDKILVGAGTKKLMRNVSIALLIVIIVCILVYIFSQVRFVELAGSIYNSIKK